MGIRDYLPFHFDRVSLPYRWPRNIGNKRGQRETKIEFKNRPNRGAPRHDRLTDVITGQHPVSASVEVPGIASLAVRDLLHGPHQAGRVLAVVQGMIIAEFPGARREPRVIAISAPDAVRLPNAVIASIPAATPNTAASPGAQFTNDAKDTKLTKGPRIRSATTVSTGGGAIRVGGLTVQARRWWDPSPVFGPLSRGRLDQGAAVLSRVCGQATPGPTLADHNGSRLLSSYCAAGDLASAVEQAESLVGLGVGIVPGGDGVLCGLLLALRLLGGAIPGGTRAVWLADWLSAAVTNYATERTTPLAASLLHCAARGQAPAEVAAVLHGVAGEDPVEPAAHRLLAARTAGAVGTADLAWGLVAGCRAAQALSVS
jgi:Protein of unknown function (DUF2877)